MVSIMGVMKPKVKAPLTVEAQRAVMGKRVKCNQIMERVHLPPDDPSIPEFRRTKYHSTWQPKDVSEFEGLITGFRWKLIGYTNYIGFEEGKEFVQTGRVFVMLVCKDPRHQPICVPWPQPADSKKDDQDGEASSDDIDSTSGSGDRKRPGVRPVPGESSSKVYDQYGKRHGADVRD